MDEGDILFAMIGSIGNPAIAPKATFSIKNVALFKYYSSQDSCSQYLYYFLKNAEDQMRGRIRRVVFSHSCR